MRLIFSFISATLLLAGPVLAQEDNLITATSALQDVLSVLKDSVQKLSIDNEQLTTRDNVLKGQILQLQTQLQQLQAQGDALTKQAAPLQDKNERRAQEISRLEKQNYDLDDQTQKAVVAIKSMQQSLGAGFEEDQKLLLQLKGLTHVLPSPLAAASPESEASASLEKQKLRLMKMIYDSQARQEALRQHILDFQKTTPLQPAASALAHQQELKVRVKGLEDQISASSARKPAANSGFADQWDDTQLGQLEGQLKSLQRNYVQLKDLLEEMGKKSQAAQITVAQKVEEEKLQNNIDELNSQSANLKNELEDLRAQMVDLDKRKSRLETMLQHL